jgi:UDP-2,4-diacetamido-2,4,6-trideoxy-beta-L-altropyranose hydrolase
MILAQSLIDCSTPLFLLNSHDCWCRDQLADRGYEFYCEELDKAWFLLPEPSVVLIDTRLCDGLDLLIATARNRGIPIISIHDLGLNPLPSDIVIDGSLVADSFKHDFSPDAEIFRGADYTILDPVFQQLHQKRRRIRKKIRSVVINLGGGDSRKFFFSILEGLKLWAQDVEAIGFKGFVPWGQECLERMDWHPLHFRWENASPGQFLFNADLAITAGGLSGYEALCAGTPLLALSYDSLQQTTIDAMAAAGACISLGPGDVLDPIQLAESLSSIDGDNDLRARLSFNGKKIIDGLGIERVSSIVRNMVYERVTAHRQEIIE